MADETKFSSTDRCCEGDCTQPVRWVRCTQFAGDHPFCEEHAKKEPDFGKEDDNFFWNEVDG